MARKKLKDEIIKIFSDRNLDMLEEVISENINKKTKYQCRDKDGYKYNLTYESVSDKRTCLFEKFGKNNIFTLENLQHFIDLNGGACKIISNEYVGMDKKIVIMCECGNTYEIRPYHLVEHKKFICNPCSIPIRTQKNIKTETEQIINKLGYTLISGNLRHDIEVEDFEGYRYATTLYNLQNKRNNYGRFIKHNKYTVYNMCRHIELNNIPVEMVDKSERKIEIRKDYVEFICQECGASYFALWGEVAYGNRHRCYNCTKRKSNLEYLVEKYLIELNIEYEPQYRFDDCRNINPLPFDFYLPKYNTTIEVNGSQHYYENEMFEQSLSERKRLDKIKHDYCINNNINYIEIPFWKIYNCSKESNTYKEIIDNILGQN